MSQSLNPRQKAAIRHLDTPLLVLAGAGSGKTRVITEKIVHLIRHCEYQARHITAVTFTNKAAREMRERVGQLSDDLPTRGLRISTFHTLGLGIIRNEVATLGLRSGFSIYDDQDSLSVLAERLKSVAADDEYLRLMRWQISSWKNDLIDPEQALELAAGDQIKTFAASLYRQYDDCLRAYNAVDFDDLITLPVKLFQQHPEVLSAWRERIRYLLVDEYQDTNTTQYELIRLLLGERRGLTVVGDDDQSIYAWRGARPENIHQLQQDYPQLTVIKLEQNYRSCANILNAANRLIENNPHLFEKSLWSDLGYGEPFRVLSAKDDEDEAERVITQLVHHKLTTGASYCQYAILYRSNHQSRLFERQLRERNIPYHLTGGTSFFSYAEVKDVLAYLRLLSNPGDDAALLRIINTPRREIGPQTLEALSRYASQRETGLLTAASELGLATQLKQRQQRSLAEFVQWVEAMTRLADSEPASVVARTVLQDIGYEDWLQSTSKDERAAQRRHENVLELIAWLRRMEDAADEPPTMSELLNKLMLIDMLDRQEDAEVHDKVQLMTLHSAKGLEFPHVFMVGMEENLLPHRSSIENDDVEEERRLAYVGITRAQRTLTFSMARQRRRYGDVESCEPSRFLDELPQDELRWQGHGVGANSNTGEKRESGQQTLSSLRALLAENEA